jgi:hypothetical protein
MQTIREILEDYRNGKLPRDQARQALISLGMIAEEADEILFIEDGGDDVIEVETSNGN